MSGTTLLVRSVYPEKTVHLSFDSSWKTVGNLLESVQKELKLDSGISSYSFYLTGYGRDIQLLSSENTMLEDLGLSTSQVIVVYPPQSTLSPLYRRKKPEKKQEDGTATDDDVFSGFTIQNCLEKYNKPTRKNEGKLAFQYIEDHITELIAEVTEKKQFSQVSEKLLTQILTSDALAVEEHLLYDFLLSWVKSKGKKEEEEKELIKKHLPHIRLPLFTAAQLAKVIPTGLLESATTLALFTYISQPEEKRVLPSTVPYSAKCRVPRFIPCIWDEKKCGPGITFSGDDKMTVNYPTYDSIACATRCLSGKDKFYWEITHTGSNSIRIGVLDETVTNLKMDLWQVGWAILGSSIYVKGTQVTSVSRGYTRGDRVGLAVDMSKRQCAFYLNGTRVGVMFTGLPDKVWPAVSNGTGVTTVVANFKLKWPSDA